MQISVEEILTFKGFRKDEAIWDREYQILHFAHTDGMNDTMGDRPFRGHLIGNTLDRWMAYMRGIEHALEYERGITPYQPNQGE